MIIGRGGKIEALLAQGGNPAGKIRVQAKWRLQAPPSFLKMR